MNCSLYSWSGRLALAALLLFLMVSGCGDDKSTSPRKTPEPSPELSMAMTCNNGLINLNVANTGGAMKQPSRFVAAYADGHIDTFFVTLDKDSTLNGLLSNIHGKVAVTNEDFALLDSAASCLPGYFRSMMESIKLSEMVTSPLGQQQVLLCTYTIYLQNLSVGGVNVELLPNDTGMVLKTTYSNITGHLSAPSPGFLCTDFSGSVSIASIVVLTNFRFHDAQPQVALGQTKATINGFHVTVDGVFGGIVSIIIGWMQNVFTSPLEDAITTAFQDYVGQDFSGLVIVDPQCGD